MNPVETKTENILDKILDVAIECSMYILPEEKRRFIVILSREHYNLFLQEVELSNKTIYHKEEETPSGTVGLYKSSQMELTIRVLD